MMLELLAFLLISSAVILVVSFIFLFVVTGKLLPITLREFKELKTQRKRAELADIQRRIKEVKSGLLLLVTNVRNTAHAEDYGSDPWRKRTENRSAEVKSDQALLRDLKAREQKLIHLLNKEG